MNKQIKIDHSIIEYLLFSLEEFPKEDADIGKLLEKCSSSEFDSFLDLQKMRIAAQARDFVDEMPGGFFIYRAGGKEELIYANKTMLKIFNCGTLEEFKAWTGNSFRGIVYPDDLDRVEESIQEQISSNVEELDCVGYRILPKGGGIRWIDGYGHYIHNTAMGDVFYVFVGDATEKKHRQEEEREKLGCRDANDEVRQEALEKQKLAQALKEENVTNYAKNLFLANMSHDIRTPMSAIVGFVALARQHIMDQEKVAGYLEKISDSSEELLRLLNDVLEIANIESGEIRVEEKECSLMKVAHQVQMDMLPQAALKDITFALDISKLRHDAVHSDPAKLTQVLTYLVDNAIKYTKKGGRISMAVVEQKERQADYAVYRFIVEDNGIGISEGFLEHIFGAFEREKNTTLSGIHGTGLGLTITKELVKMLGGTIDISSKLGKGSKFTITLPIRMQNSGKHCPGDENAAPACFLDTKRILVVDDNEINLEIEYEVLKDAGYLVDTAMDGSIAFEKIKQSQPGDYDLILMDIQMPVMDGYHATRAIRELEDPLLAKIPIIAVSANSFEADRRMSMECGMNAHLAKPLDVPYLFKVMHEYLRDADA